MQVEQEFFIGIEDVGLNNEMRNKAFLEALSNTANVHGTLVGHGINEQGKRPVSWIVLNWKLEVYKRPKVCETIRVRTWSREYSRLRAYRDFDIFNQKGENIAKAASVWIAVNPETGKPLRLHEDIMSVYRSEPDHKAFPEYNFIEAVDTDLPIVSQTRFKINKSMIDYNNHVHNSSYMDLVNEVLPEGMDEVLFNNLEICYKKEITPHEEVLLEYAKDGEKNYVFMWDENRSVLHATVEMY